MGCVQSSSMLPAEDTKGLRPKPINTLETHPSLTVCVVTSPTSQPVSPKNSTLSELGIDADEGIEEGVDDEEFNLDRGQLGSQSKYGTGLEIKVPEKDRNSSSRALSPKKIFVWKQRCFQQQCYRGSELRRRRRGLVHN